MSLYETTRSEYSAAALGFRRRDTAPALHGIPIPPRIPIRIGSILKCPCGGRIYSDGYEYKCILCGWDHWDLRPNAIPYVPPPPPPAEIMAGVGRVQCRQCQHVWVLDGDAKDTPYCPGCTSASWRSQNHYPIRLCDRPGCNDIAHGHGLCDLHYQQTRIRKRDTARNHHPKWMRPEGAAQLPVTVEGVGRVRCYSCGFVWILAVSHHREQGECPSCGTEDWRTTNHRPIKLCDAPGCNKVADAHGLCQPHYSQTPGYAERRAEAQRKHREKVKLAESQRKHRAT